MGLFLNSLTRIESRSPNALGEANSASPVAPAASSENAPNMALPPETTTPQLPQSPVPAELAGTTADHPFPLEELTPLPDILSALDEPAAPQPSSEVRAPVELGGEQSAADLDWRRLEELQKMVLADLADLKSPKFDFAASKADCDPPGAPPPAAASQLSDSTAAPAEFSPSVEIVSSLGSEVTRLDVAASAEEDPSPLLQPCCTVIEPPPPLADLPCEQASRPKPPETAPIVSPAPAVAPKTWPSGTPLPPVVPPAEAAPAMATFAAASPTPTIQPPLNLQPEFRELRDQLLAQLDLTTHPTLLLVDAGRETNNAAWLWPLATGVVDKLNAARRDAESRILLVEAAGPNCGLANTLGIDTHVGLNYVLNGRSEWPGAIQSTLHPQIKLLTRGSEALEPGAMQRMKAAWAELSRQFDLLLVAVGSIIAEAHSDHSTGPKNLACDLFLPLATAAMLYVELGCTSPEAADHAKRLLDAQGIKLLGCVIQSE